MIRAEMNSGGVDLTMCKEALSDALVYLALTHNHFSKGSWFRVFATRIWDTEKA